VKYHPFFAIIFGLWFLAVWSVFGGAIARVAAVHVARDEKISVRQALKFSIGKFLSFFFAPLIPLAIVVAIGALIALGGLLMYVSYVGPILVGLLFFLALVAGFVMTLVVLGTVGGFNLMYPTVAVEGSDSFDAISRSFSYVYARPWRMLFYIAVAVVYGALTYLFVRIFLFLVLGMTHYFVQWWLGGQPSEWWPVIWSGPSAWELTHRVHFSQLHWTEDTSAALIAFWVYLVVSLLGAYAISFYFSANTIIYYLMRQEVDATELDDVYLEQTEEEFTESPAAAPGTSTAVPPAGNTEPAGEPTSPPESPAV
jgi:hypothetical protein